MSTLSNTTRACGFALPRTSRTRYTADGERILW